MRSIQLKAEELAEGSAFYQSRAYDIGDTVSVIGKIEVYREVRQIYVASIREPVRSLYTGHRNLTRFQNVVYPKMPNLGTCLMFWNTIALGTLSHSSFHHSHPSQ